MILPFQTQFIEMAIARQALQFGDFTLKSGIQSPYFFNVGKLCTGQDWLTLGQCYAEALVHYTLPGDQLFGAAYKGIPLVSVTALMLAQKHHRNYPTTYNRKEIKDHGEGGLLVGASIQDKAVILIDDVLTKGTALSEAKATIERAGGYVSSILVALDRQEQQNGKTVRESLSDAWQVPMTAIANIQDVITYLFSIGETTQAQRIQTYIHFEK